MKRILSLALFALCGHALMAQENFQINGHAYVDLGLPSGTLWATCNVGASSPWEPGNYYAWGEIEPKEAYREENCWTSELPLGDISGFDKCDVATAVWGKDWGVPTAKELKELAFICEWRWGSMNGCNVYRVTGPNGKSIFLPAAGYAVGGERLDYGNVGLYWSSSPSAELYQEAQSLSFYHKASAHMGETNRSYGYSVRPVVRGTALIGESSGVDFLEEEMIPITENTPPPPPMIPVLSDLVNTDSSSEDGASNGVEIVEDPIPFQLVDVKPSFQGGDAITFSKWVNQRLVYPEIAKANGVQGRVTLQFTVEKDGRVTNVRIIRGADPSLDKEAIRVVQSSPKWKPGKQRDRLVPVTYTFPVIFSLN